MSAETGGLLLALLLIALAFGLYRRHKNIGMSIVLGMALVTWLGGYNWQRLKHVGFSMKGDEVSLGIDFGEADVQLVEPTTPPNPSATGTTTPTAPIPPKAGLGSFTKNVGRMPATTVGVKFTPKIIGHGTGKYYFADLYGDVPTRNRLSVFAETLYGRNFLTARLFDDSGSAYAVRRDVEDWRVGDAHTIFASAGSIEDGKGRLRLYVDGHSHEVEIPNWRGSSLGPWLSMKRSHDSENPVVE